LNDFFDLCDLDAYHHNHKIIKITKIIVQTVLEMEKKVREELKKYNQKRLK
jgi:hypothetical protein